LEAPVSWVDIEDRVAAASKFDASVRLWVRGRKTQSLPVFIIALRKPLMATLKWKPKDTFGLQIGQGDTAGKVRVVRRTAKATGFARWLKTGALLLDFGHLAPFGDRGSLKADAVARTIDPDTVEITLPEFCFEDEAEGEDEEPPTPPRAAAAAPPAKPTAPFAPKPASSAAPARAIGEPPFTANGVTVSFDKDEERITFAGKETEITYRQALICAALAKAMPNAVNRGFLITRVFGLRPPATAEMVLDQIAIDLGKALPTIGLKLRNTKGVGFALEAA
jgi:hypothetical protein